MLGQLLDPLNDWPLSAYMFVVALGFSVGRITWRRIALGPAAGTLLVALVCGGMGLSIQKMYDGVVPELTLGTFGFALFVYSVGFEAGPRFFASLRHRAGWQFAILGLLVNVLAIGLVLIFNALWHFGGAATPGVLAGAMTSAPTYAAALEVVKDPSALAYSFALAYPFGLAGVVLLIHFLPRLMRDDLAAGTDDEDTGDVRDEADPIDRRRMRSFEVEMPDVIGRPLRELRLTNITSCTITRLHRGQSVTVPNADTVLEAGDHVSVRGTVGQLHVFEQAVGREVYDEELRRRLPSGRAVRVQSREVIGKRLVELALIDRFHCVLTRVRRGEVDLTPEAGLTLARDDVVHVAGSRENVRRLADYLGRFERSSNETDIAVYAAGIFGGVLLGNAHFGPVRLGFATGLLISGLLLGRFRRIGVLNAHVPVAARQLVRDLGILLFVAEAGLNAGAAPAPGWALAIPIVIAGIFVTAIPMALAVAFGRYILRMRPVDAWGSVCGGMTSSAAIIALRRAADSNEPALSYATAYAIGSVVLTVAGPLVAAWSG